jgi:hypothetical protein
MTKSEFLAQLRAARARLDERLARLSQAELTARAPDAWSIKDNLAHLTFWEQYMLDQVRRCAVGAAAPQWMSNEEEAATNARLLRDNWDRPLAEVLADMRRSLDDVIAQVAALSEADLTDPARFAWLNGKPLWTYIENESFGEHYHEHLRALMA